MKASDHMRTDLDREAVYGQEAHALSSAILVAVYEYEDAGRHARTADEWQEMRRQFAEKIKRHCGAVLGQMSVMLRTLQDTIADVRNRQLPPIVIERNEDAEERSTALSHQLESDRTLVAAGVTAAAKVIDSFYWLTEGRGSYEWDDDRYRSEFKNAAVEILKALEPLKRIVTDWSGCPMTAAEVAQARIDWKQKAEAARRRVAALETAVALLREAISFALQPDSASDLCSCKRCRERAEEALVATSDLTRSEAETTASIKEGAI